jgi:hypothetical protein
VVQLGERNIIQGLMRKPGGKSHLKDGSIDGKLVLKYIIKK